MATNKKKKKSGRRNSMSLLILSVSLLKSTKCQKPDHMTVTTMC